MKLQLLTGGGGSSAAQLQDSGVVPAPQNTVNSAPSVRYSDAEFLMGHGSKWRPTEKEWFRIDEAYIAEARRWLEHMSGHYQTLSDVYVHAVVRHLTITLPAWEGDIEDSVLHQLKQIGEVCAREEFELRFIKIIDRIGAVVAETLELPGGRVEVSALLRRIKRHIDAMRPSFHKSYFEKMFNDRFGAFAVAGLIILETSGEEQQQDENSDAELTNELIQLLQQEEPKPNE